MILSEYIKNNITDCFAALPFQSCSVTNARLLRKVPFTYAIMMAVPYPHDGEGRRIAAFAALRDYHIFFSSFEKDAAAEIAKKYPECVLKIFSDHSPIDERRAAVTAGLGAIGDNGLFISRKYGSFVFIGEMLVTLGTEALIAEGIEINDGKAGECLHCGLCAKVCPSGCIGGDKSWCASALTQKKGDLSDSEKDIIIRAGSAWGCDACADVCPLNMGCDETYNPFFDRKIDPRCAADIEAMSDDEFSSYPFSWRKKEVIIRNFRIIDGEDVR